MKINTLALSLLRMFSSLCMRLDTLALGLLCMQLVEPGTHLEGAVNSDDVLVLQARVDADLSVHLQAAAHKLRQIGSLAARAATAHVSLNKNRCVSAFTSTCSCR